MDDASIAQSQLNRLRKWRNIPDRHNNLAFLRDNFKQHIEIPHKQVNSIVDAWQQLVPEEITVNTRLQSLRHGTLTVLVTSSAALHALDRLLRQGLESDLRTATRTVTLRRIRLRRG